jgi:hypothetical protein
VPEAFPKAFAGLMRGKGAAAGLLMRASDFQQRLDPFVEFPVWRHPLPADPGQGGLRQIDQPFSSGSIFFWNSSNEVSPLILSPLTKKVGVESTFSTSAAYF